MADKAYLIRSKESDRPPDVVIPANLEFHGEHLVFRRADGALISLYVPETVENWSEFELGH
jgi:hypothetical protein